MNKLSPEILEQSLTLSLATNLRTLRKKTAHLCLLLYFDWACSLNIKLWWYGLGLYLTITEETWESVSRAVLAWSLYIPSIYSGSHSLITDNYSSETTGKRRKRTALFFYFAVVCGFYRSTAAAPRTNLNRTATEPHTHAIEPQPNLNRSVRLFLDSTVHMDALNILALFRVPHNSKIRKWAKASYFWARPFLCQSLFLIDFPLLFLVWRHNG